MRLTIGGALLLLGIGGAAGYLSADKAHLDLVLGKLKGLTDQATSLIGLIKSGDSEKKEVYSPPPPFPNGVTDQASNSGPANQVSTSTASIPNQPATVASPIPTATIKPTTSQVASKVRKRRKRRGVAPAQPISKSATSTTLALTHKNTKGAKKAAAKKAALSPGGAKDPIQAMMGTYVSMELVTGRAVQGILESKSATHYMLNVPGLGPLEYPIDNVKIIVPAR